MTSTTCDRCGKVLPSDVLLDNNCLTRQTTNGPGNRWDFCDRCWRVVWEAITTVIRQVKCAIVVALLAASACGGSPSSPTPTDGGWLAGTWRGTLLITADGQPPFSGQTVWTLTTTPSTKGLLYSTRVDSTHPWFAAHVPPVTTSMEPPGTAPATVHTTGLYPSPRGCQGSFYSVTTADAHALSGSFYGIDCGVRFTGTVTLSRP